MTQRPNPIPVRPDYASAARNAPVYIERASFVAAKAAATYRDAAAVFDQYYPNDNFSRSLLSVTRASVAPASTTTSGNASQLIQTAVRGFLTSLAQSAAATLMARGLQINLETDGIASVSIPIRSTDPITPHWVTELNPIPVKSDALASVALGPARKLGSIVVMSRSLLKRSDAENIFTTMLREDASRGLDAAVFSTETGSGDAHQGLLYGATAVVGGGTLLQDMQALAASVSADGSGQVVFIGCPAFAAAAGLDATIRATVLSSQAVPETRLIAVDPLSLAWGTGSDPDIDVSTEAVVHMSDDPMPIVTGGVTADPTRSLWQTDAVATRMILPVAFAKRRAGAVAVIDNFSSGW